MIQLINDLYKLSDNAALFAHLRAGHDFTALASRLSESSRIPPKAVNSKLLQAVRDALVLVLQSNKHSSLYKLIEDADVNARVIIVGELLLTLYALKEGKHSGEKVEAILEQAFRLTCDLARAFEIVDIQHTDNEKLLVHGIAMREWAHLFAGYYQAAGTTIYHNAEMLMVRARVTNRTLSSCPHLVGSAMIDVALALESVGKIDMAINCYNGIRMDLAYLIKRIDDPAFSEFEKVSALYWLQRACEEFHRLVPNDASATYELQKVRKLRQERGYPNAVSVPRFGPIAKTYLPKTPFLALILRALEESYDPNRHSESVSAICQRYGCLSSDVDFYLSAMDSYVIRNTILRDVQSYYDDAHQEVFAAIDYLRGLSN
ncbi:hypothetical protein [Aliterella atlantica]|uniref:Uncharacterized protein n=1 Tax=Aliterella atlantica CENA595 TaxID=1618023 RepID=A0A0D8ZM08_9CYAN|nr:hypothetical protein [Aliterella atlantica]KJH69765.1 hypothetical protein UH38_21845 [Aliterella atlantica CENA595]